MVGISFGYSRAAVDPWISRIACIKTAPFTHFTTLFGSSRVFKDAKLESD